jgi:hypothetical protein
MNILMAELRKLSSSLACQPSRTSTSRQCSSRASHNGAGEVLTGGTSLLECLYLRCELLLQHPHFARNGVGQTEVFGVSLPERLLELGDEEEISGLIFWKTL